MPPQPPRLAQIPAAVELTVSDLSGTDGMPVINGGPLSAVTTINVLGKYFSVAPSVLAYGATGDGTTNDRQAFVDSEAAQDNNYVPPGTYLIGSNLTLSSRVVFQEGSILKPASGVTITLNGAVTAELWQIFDLSLGGSVILNDVPAVQARWFGASPSASGTINAAAINAAITCAKASQNADLVFGPGIIPISSTLNYAGIGGLGITTIGIDLGSQNQGSTPGICVLKWVGGASPMIDVEGTFHTFHGFSMWNVGNGAAVATHGIYLGVCGRQWINRVMFSAANGGSAFTTASIEFVGGVNYDRVTLCEFEVGRAILVSGGGGTTLLVDQFLMDSPLGTGALVDIRGDLDVLTLREGTVNFQAGMSTFIDMSNIASHRVSVCRVTGTEFDGNVIAAQLTVAKVKNCDSFIFEANQISSFSDAANVESPITAIDSRVTVRNNVIEGVAQPLVHTLDATSYVYAYEGNQVLANTKGNLTANSQSGTLVNAVLSGTDIIVQGNLASAMSCAVFLATLTTPNTTYTAKIAAIGDSSNKGFMTPGQVFTLEFFNNSGGDLGTILFSASFSLSTPLPTPPPDGKRMSVTFQWDGTLAREINRQYDPNPAWAALSTTQAITLAQRYVKADATAGDITLSLPRADTAQSGARFTIKKVTAANTVTIAGGAFAIDGSFNQALAAQWSSMTVESDSTQWLIVAKV